MGWWRFVWRHAEKLSAQAPQASFVRAMMTPPNLPGIPFGWPNIRLKTFRMMLIDRSPDCSWGEHHLPQFVPPRHHLPDRRGHCHSHVRRRWMV
jgi:hypothetical protein